MNIKDIAKNILPVTREIGFFNHILTGIFINSKTLFQKQTFTEEEAKQIENKAAFYLTINEKSDLKIYHKKLSFINRLHTTTVYDHELRHYHDFLLSVHGSEQLVKFVDLNSNFLEILNLIGFLHQKNKNKNIYVPLLDWIQTEKEFISEEFYSEIMKFKEHFYQHNNYSRDSTLNVHDIYEGLAIIQQAQCIHQYFGKNCCELFIQNYLQKKETNSYNKIIKFFYKKYGKLDLKLIATILFHSLNGDLSSRKVEYFPNNRLREILKYIESIQGEISGNNILSILEEFYKKFNLISPKDAIIKNYKINFKNFLKVKKQINLGAEIYGFKEEYYIEYFKLRKKIIREYLKSEIFYTEPNHYNQIKKNLPIPKVYYYVYNIAYIKDKNIKIFSVKNSEKFKIILTSKKYGPLLFEIKSAESSISLDSDEFFLRANFLNIIILGIWKSSFALLMKKILERNFNVNILDKNGA